MPRTALGSAVSLQGSGTQTTEALLEEQVQCGQTTGEGL